MEDVKNKYCPFNEKRAGRAGAAGGGAVVKALLNAIIRILFGRRIPKFSDNMLRKEEQK